MMNILKRSILAFTAAGLIVSCQSSEKTSGSGDNTQVPTVKSTPTDTITAQEAPMPPGAKDPKPTKPTAQASPPGLVTIDSPHSVADTATKLEAAIKAKGLTHFTTIQHHVNAKGVGLELRPTTLVLFGNPKMGTGLMNASQTIGIDLPMKMLIWQDQGGATHSSYNAPTYLAERHAAKGAEPLVQKATGALKGLASAAVAPE